MHRCNCRNTCTIVIAVHFSIFYEFPISNLLLHCLHCWEIIVDSVNFPFPWLSCGVGDTEAKLIIWKLLHEHFNQSALANSRWPTEYNRAMFIYHVLIAIILWLGLKALTWSAHAKVFTHCGLCTELVCAFSLGKDSRIYSRVDSREKCRECFFSKIISPLSEFRRIGSDLFSGLRFDLGFYLIYSFCWWDERFLISSSLFLTCRHIFESWGKLPLSFSECTFTPGLAAGGFPRSGTRGFIFGSGTRVFWRSPGFFYRAILHFCDVFNHIVKDEIPLKYKPFVLWNMFLEYFSR